MPTEVGPTGFGNIDLVGDDAVIGNSLNTFVGTLNVPDGLLHVTLDVEGETGGLGDGETKVEGDNTGDASETDEETPAVVNASGCGGGIMKDATLVGVDDDEGDEGGS